MRDLAEKLSQKSACGYFIAGVWRAPLGPLRVTPTQHAACDVGDEPLLLATTAPPHGWRKIGWRAPRLWPKKGMNAF
ncbi:MAG: hypothetical protein H6925_02335 [Holosporaceae bacterium]|nr:MAG: hypothetical protein H6925_02335 [Holosporaceae bacterium]